MNRAQAPDGAENLESRLSKESTNTYGALFGRIVSITEAPGLMAADGSTTLPRSTNGDYPPA